MTRRYLCAPLALLALLATPLSASAIPITTPTDLNPGDQYRLAFVTSGSRDATSSNIADYDAFVQSAADAVPELNALAITWRVVGSTSTVDARTHTSTNPAIDGVGVPIYLLDGSRVRDDYADLWNTSVRRDLTNEFFCIRENDPTFSCVSAFTHTGTFNDGSAEAGLVLGDVSGFDMGGLADANFGGWIRQGSSTLGQNRHFYALSDTLTVSEPSTAHALTLVFAALLLVRRVQAA